MRKMRILFCHLFGDIDMIAFERIKELAKNKGMSLVDVNDKAGLGTRTIYHWKTKQPSNDSLKAVAKVLNTSTDYLNGLTDNPLPQSKKQNVQADLDDDDTIFTFQGRPIPPEDLKIIRRLLKNDDDE